MQEAERLALRDSMSLVLSLFPGIGMLDRAFELEGFCVVRGPDLLWGGDVKEFHPPAGHFNGVIGGPPCTGESDLAYLNGEPGFSLAGEFMRIMEEADPLWYVMEAVKQHSANHVLTLNNRWLGEEQSRLRYFHSNLRLKVAGETFENPTYKHAVLAGHGGAVGSVQRGMAKYSVGDALELQGFPREMLEHAPFTRQAKSKLIGNGVPLPMGLAVARAVKKALEA